MEIKNNWLLYITGVLVVLAIVSILTVDRAEASTQVPFPDEGQISGFGSDTYFINITSPYTFSATNRTMRGRIFDSDSQTEAYVGGGTGAFLTVSGGVQRPMTAGVTLMGYAGQSIEAMEDPMSSFYLPDGNYRNFFCLVDNSVDCQNGTSVNLNSGTWSNLMAANNVYYFDFEVNAGQIVPPPTGGTRIININSPAASAVTASTTVNFSVDYRSDIPIPDQICINLTNLTVGQSIVPICQTISQSDNLNFSTSTVLTSAHVYRYQVVILNDENQTIDISSSNRYFTVEVAQQSNWVPTESGWGYGPIP